MGFERKVSYTEGEARLPYSLEWIKGSDRLVVVFPKFAPGQTRPAFGLRRLLGDFHAHRLYFGGDEHFFLGPKKRYRSHPLLSIECTRGTYAEHGEIGAPFKEFLREQFLTLDFLDV